jgi:hypothetical protein
MDISLGIMPFEEEVIERSSVHEFDEALQLRLPTPEDLIIMKAVAHRPIDLEDIRTLALKYTNLDLNCVKLWITDFADILEAPELWNQIEQILQSVK